MAIRLGPLAPRTSTRLASRPLGAPAAVGGAVAVIDAVPPRALRAEIEALPANQRLVECGDFHVYYASAHQLPRGLQEIGRLRELTFRAVGEGTGRCSDLDAFDPHYLHMFVWDVRRRAIAGAYRLGLVDEILARQGKRGLYTYSLFRYRTRLLHALNPAIELGRSFVCAEYQRTFAPLMLLWCGIGRFVARSPRYATLFGPVSISGRYAPASRRLIVDHLSRYSADSRLASQVTPRRPFREAGPALASEVDAPACRTIDELSRRIAQIEPDGKGVPVLLRHYLRLGGRLLGFSIDASFANALDGLIMVDLRQIEPTMLKRYMGKSESATFRAYHARVSG
jgi:putative hemolysin